MQSGNITNNSNNPHTNNTYAISENKVDLLGVLHEEFKFIQSSPARKYETEKTPIVSSMSAPKGLILILILKY